VDRSYEKDPYVQKWFVGLNRNTKGNYLRHFKEWLDFVKMSPTEQIEKRTKDMISTDLTERQFFARALDETPSPSFVFSFKSGIAMTSG
jgi:hypothetical protein